MMAGVDHSYQYSVEVKSRFSLFLDDSLSNEDPELLISKIQTKRTERCRKEKNIAACAPCKPAQAAHETEVLCDGLMKAPAKSPAQLSGTPLSEQHPGSRNEACDPRAPSVARGRGDGFWNRGVRGRGRGLRQSLHDAGGDMSTEQRVQSGASYEPRSRGRGRGRFLRDRRGAFTDCRSIEANDHGLNVAVENEVRVLTSDHTNVVRECTEQPNVESVADAAAKNGTDTDIPHEKEPKTYTLQEYKALRGVAKPVLAVTTKNYRKANDGKDVFVNMVPHRKTNDVSEVDEEEEVEAVEKTIEPEQPFEIDVTFTDRCRGRGMVARVVRGRGVGFRGAVSSRGYPASRTDRGERGKGLSRGWALDQRPTPVINSDQDFPSLK